MKKQILTRVLLPSLLGISLLGFAHSNAHADGAEILKSQCSACHALTPPVDNSLDRVWNRGGPDLYYAGVKFKRDWLVEWLQKPTPIRPAGYPYFKNVIAGDQHDQIDKSKLKEHARLSEKDARDVADALTALKGPAGLVEAGLFKNESPNVRMGEMAFVKIRGCSACHEGKGGEGGMSAPELTDAGKRLQPDFIASYMKNPQKIDPHIWMPALKITDRDIERLTGYIIQLSSEEKK